MNWLRIGRENGQELQIGFHGLDVSHTKLFLGILREEIAFAQKWVLISPLIVCFCPKSCEAIPNFLSLKQPPNLSFMPQISLF